MQATDTLQKLNEHDATLFERLTAMELDDYADLHDMADGALVSLLDELNKTARTLDELHPFVVARGKAMQAIAGEQRRRSGERFQRWQEHQRRSGGIVLASNLIAQARETLEGLTAIPDGEQEPPPVPALDVSEAADAQLSTARAECLYIVNAARGRTRQDAETIALLKTPEARKFAAELRRKADADDCRRAEAAELVASIDAELERRANERKAEEERLKPKSLEQRIAELEAIINEQKGER